MSNLDTIDSKLRARISTKESLTRAIDAIHGEQNELEKLLNILRDRRLAVYAEIEFENARREVTILHEELFVIDEQECKQRMGLLDIGVARATLKVSEDAAVEVKEALAAYVDSGGNRCPRCTGRCNLELTQEEDSPRRMECQLCDLVWELNGE